MSNRRPLWRCSVMRPHWVCGLLIVLAPVLAAGEDTGGALFERQCQSCHTGGPATLRAEPAQLPDILRNGTVHRLRFTLTDNQIDSLADYFRDARSRP